jgi:hypothetical protein
MKNISWKRETYCEHNGNDTKYNIKLNPLYITFLNAYFYQSSGLLNAVP